MDKGFFKSNYNNYPFCFGLYCISHGARSFKGNDERFTSKAPAHILDRERKIEAEYLDKLNKLEENLKAFSK